jgi:hypothetical protein
MSATRPFQGGAHPLSCDGFVKPLTILPSPKIDAQQYGEAEDILSVWQGIGHWVGDELPE